MPNRIGDYGNTSSVYNGITVNTPYDNSDQSVKVEDFLQLMIAQLTNQDFMNPVDDTQYVTQLAQFATMQSMQELSHYSQTSYVASLVGKTVTVATLGIGGAVNKDVGVVSAVNLSGDKYTFTVNGKQYELSQIMSISDTKTTVEKNELEAANNMALYVNEVGKNSIKLSWDSPIGDDRKDSLVYDVYYTEDGQVDFNDLSVVKKGTLAADGLKSNTATITDLEPGKTYFINVVVRNTDGTEAVYQKTTQVTKS